MSDIHDQLKAALLEFRQLQKVRSHYDTLAARLEEESARIEGLGNTLQKEERDVRRLENTSIRSLFHQVLGDREKQIEKERQEYLQVALKYNELAESINLVEYELGVLEKKLARFDLVEKEYRDLLKAREHELMTSNPSVGNELLLLSQKLDAAHVQLKDIDEALEAGKAGLAQLQGLIGDLKKARDWGQWDIHGGGTFAGWSKHEAMDQARARSVHVKHSLLKFQEELRDVYANARIEMYVDLGSFSKFTDIFFDNLITDWVVQQKIKKALDDVKRVKMQVERTIQQLEEEGPRVQDEIVSLEQQREQIIIESISEA